MSSDVQMNTDSLTLEETNIVRISLGLKPIGVAAMEGEDSPIDADLQAEENHARRRVEMDAEQVEKELKEKIHRSKNRLALNTKLSGPTLGSSKSDDLSTKAWARKLNKRTAQNAQMTARRAREMEERDAAAYNESELAGLKVNHAPEDFEAGEDIILTLKDTRVLATDEDGLQNLALIEDEALRAAKEKKRKAQEIYAGYDDEEFNEDRIGKKAEILGKYSDSFATGTIKPEGFRLGASLKKEDEVEENLLPIMTPPQSKVKLNLDYAKDYEVGDYAKEGEAGFKKLRNKKVKRSTRKAGVDGEGMGTDVDVAGSGMGRRHVDAEPANLVDDDDLQAALARSRREAARNKPKVKAADVVGQIASSRQHDHLDTEPKTSVEEGRGVITFDPVSEFVRNITIGNPQRRFTSAQSTPLHALSAGTLNTTSIDSQTSTTHHERPISAQSVSSSAVSRSEGISQGDISSRELSEIADNSMDERELVTDSSFSSKEFIPSVPASSSGLATYLTSIRQSGNMSQSSAEATRNEIEQRKAGAWKAQHRELLARHELERSSARYSKVDQAQREADNRALVQRQSRELEALLSEYKPHVEVRYHDESGREMSKPEAWKSLSHRFHGKGSGRIKSGKRLQKLATERKREQMLASDTPSGMSQAFSRRQEKTGEAYMVLGTGNKGSVQAGGGGKRRG